MSITGTRQIPRNVILNIFDRNGLTLNRVAKKLPSTRRAGHVSVSSLSQWFNSGCNSRRFERKLTRMAARLVAREVWNRVDEDREELVLAREILRPSDSSTPRVTATARKLALEILAHEDDEADDLVVLAIGVQRRHEREIRRERFGHIKRKS